MSNRSAITAGSVAVAAVTFVVMRDMNRPPERCVIEQQIELEEHARNSKDILELIKATPVPKDEPLWLVGDLVVDQHMSRALALSAPQKEVIRALDDAARYGIRQHSAGSPGARPRSEFSSHAVCMVLSGLLSDEQADLIHQWHHGGNKPREVFSDPHLRILFGITEAQSRKLASIELEAETREERLEAEAIKRGDEVRWRHRADIEDYVDESILATLSPEQRSVWDALQVRITPLEQPPQLAAIPSGWLLSDEHSRVFRAVHENLPALELTAEQEVQFHRLQLATCTGIVWLQARNERQAPRLFATANESLLLSEFLESAETLLLTGVLGEEQQNRIEELLKDE